MPKKSKITAVPIEEPTEQPVSAEVDEQKTDAQEMTEVLNEVKDVSEPVAVEQVAPKAKASSRTPTVKRASRAKAPIEVSDPVVEVTPALDETVVEVAIPMEANKEVKASEKVSCPDCGKQMSAKTLKYSHVPNCLVKKQKEAHGQPEPFANATITDEMIEQEIEKRLTNRRAERMVKRQKDLEKLVAGAF